VEAFLERQGFVPEIDVDEERVTISECHCPFAQGVRATRLPCRLEARFLEQALQKKLRRAGYMPEGHRACVYEFSLGDEQEGEGESAQ
jgi:predicted ArsR family transcriptional regulator